MGPSTATAPTSSAPQTATDAAPSTYAAASSVSAGDRWRGSAHRLQRLGRRPTATGAARIPPALRRAGSPTENLRTPSTRRSRRLLRNFGGVGGGVVGQFAAAAVRRRGPASSPLTAPRGGGRTTRARRTTTCPSAPPPSTRSRSRPPHPRPMAAAARPPRLLCVEPAATTRRRRRSSRAPSCEGEAWVVDDVGDTAPPALDSCALAVREESVAEYVPAAATADSLAATLGYARYLGAAFAAYDAVDAAWREVLIFGLAAPAGVLLIWIVVLQFWAGLLVWTSLLSLVASLAALSYFLCSRGGLLGDISLPADAPPSPTATPRCTARRGERRLRHDDAVAAAANQTADRAAAASLVLSLVAVSLAWRRAIHRSICVVKEAAYAVWFCRSCCCARSRRWRPSSPSRAAPSPPSSSSSPKRRPTFRTPAGLDAPSASPTQPRATRAVERRGDAAAVVAPRSQRQRHRRRRGGPSSYHPPTAPAAESSIDVGRHHLRRRRPLDAVGFSGSFGGVADRRAVHASHTSSSRCGGGTVAATGWTIIAGAVSRWFFRASNAKRTSAARHTSAVVPPRSMAFARRSSAPPRAAVDRDVTYHAGRARRTKRLVALRWLRDARRALRSKASNTLPRTVRPRHVNGRGFYKSRAVVHDDRAEPGDGAVNWTVKRRPVMVASTVASCTPPSTSIGIRRGAWGYHADGRCAPHSPRRARRRARPRLSRASPGSSRRRWRRRSRRSSAARSTRILLRAPDIDASRGHSERMLRPGWKIATRSRRPTRCTSPPTTSTAVAAKEPLPPGGALSGIYGAGGQAPSGGRRSSSAAANACPRRRRQRRRGGWRGLAS